MKDKFFLIEIVDYVDETPTSKGIYEYPDMDAAVASFHKKLGGNMSNANCAACLLKVVKPDNHDDIEYGYWERKPVEVEAE